MRLSATWNTKKLRAKLARFSRRADEQSMASLKEYGAEACKLMVKATPPAGMRKTPAAAIAALKKRIKTDLEGEGEKPFSEEVIRWITMADGTRLAFISTKQRGKLRHGRASAFRVYRGSVSASKLAALNVGKYGVEHAQNLRSFIKKHSSDYYYTQRGGVCHFRWQNTRHVASLSAVRQEVRRRQGKVGKLMAGWKPLARKSGTKLPAGAERQQGNGSVEVARSRRHKAIMTAHNRGHYKGLQKLVDRQVPYLRKRLKRLALRHKKRLAGELK